VGLNNRSFQRIATRFNRLYVKLSAFKDEPTGYGDYQGSPMMVIKLPPGQTANAFEVHDYQDNLLYAIGATGSPSVTGSTAVSGAVAQFTLTAANIKAMYTTPVTVLAAPAAGLAILVKSIHVQTKPTATQFTSGGVVTFQYHGTAVLPHDAADTIAATVINSATGTNNQMAPISAGIQIPTATGIDITNATGVFATGTGTAVVTIAYDLITLA
jgi:hypothetical protein